MFTGLYYWAPWSKRPYDSCGIATGYNRVSGNVRKAQTNTSPAILVLVSACNPMSM